MDPVKYFEILKKHFSTAVKTELYYVNEFTLAIAVILSAQTTDKHVNTVTPELFAIADSPEKILKLKEDGLKDYIKSISFFNNKTKNIIKLSECLIAQYSSKLPHDRNELMKLPGIGRKTANVISNVLWNAPNIGVDTHVFRLAHRFEWVDEADNTPEKVEVKLLKLIPKEFHNVANHLMVLHGRYFCKAKKTDCANCPVFSICSCKQLFYGIK